MLKFQCLTSTLAASSPVHSLGIQRPSFHIPLAKIWKRNPWSCSSGVGSPSPVRIWEILSKNHVLKYYLSPLSSPASPSWWETCCWWDGACCAWPCSHHHPPPWHLGKYFSLKTRVTLTKQMNMLCTETLHHSSALHKRSEQAMFSFHRWWGNLRWGEATWFEATWEK